MPEQLAVFGGNADGALADHGHVLFHAGAVADDRAGVAGALVAVSLQFRLRFPDDGAGFRLRATMNGPCPRGEDNPVAIDERRLTETPARLSRLPKILFEALAPDFFSVRRRQQSTSPSSLSA